MTDWLATSNGMASVVACIEAGNDLIMPGEQAEVDQLIQAAKDGKLDLEKLKGCAERVIDIVSKSNRYEDCQPYLERLDACKIDGSSRFPDP
jgi:beta-glucosidase